MPALSQTFVSKQNGEWNIGSTWDKNTCAPNPSVGSPPFEKSYGCSVNILIKHHVTHIGNVTNFGNGVVGGMEITPTGSLSINGNFEIPSSGWGTYLPYIKIAEGVTWNVSGTLNIGRKIHLVIPRNTTVTVGQLILGDNDFELTVEEGGELIVMNHTQLKSNSKLNVKGSFITKNLTNNSGSLNGLKEGSIQVDEATILNSGSISLSENSVFQNGRNLVTNGSASISARGYSKMTIGEDILVSQGASFDFFGHSHLDGGGDLTTSGGTSVNFHDSSVGRIKDNITLVQGASLNLKKDSFFTMDGDIRLDGGGVFSLSGDSEGIVGGNILLNWNKYNSNGELKTSQSSELFVTGRLVAGRDRQVNVENVSSVSICDYPNSTQLESLYVVKKPGGYYGPGCFILPVEWLKVEVDYEAQLERQVLKWTTANEIENSHFEVEKSIGGIDHFETIGRVESTGIGNASSIYSYHDHHFPLMSEFIYYRIKQVDITGQSHYSETVMIKLPLDPGKNPEWLAYPNPTMGEELKLVFTHAPQVKSDPIFIRMFSYAFASQVKQVYYGQTLDVEVQNFIREAPKGIIMFEIKWGKKVSYLKVVNQ